MPRTLPPTTSSIRIPGKQRRPGMRILATWLLLAALGTSGCAGRQPVASSPSPATASSTNAGAAGAAMLLGEVQRELAAMRHTRYQHTTKVDEATGTFFYDCSGMVDYALKQVRPADLQALTTSTKSRPLAGDITSYLNQGLTSPVNNWQALNRVDQLGAGDVIAWLATEDSTTGDTGHVMVAAAPATQNPARAGEWLVQVVDSTISPHARDSRQKGVNGLGTGTIGLVVDDRDAPTAFYWQGGISPEAKPTEIALGRPL